MSLKKSLDGASRAMRNLGEAFGGYSQGGIVPRSSEHNDKLELALSQGNMHEYKRLREKEDTMQDVYSGMSGYAYLPLGGQGKLLRVDCIIVEVNYEHMEHFSSRGGLRIRDQSFLTSIDVNLKINGPGEEVDDTFSGSLNDYSIIDLLTEVEKRTRIEELMSS